MCDRQSIYLQPKHLNCCSKCWLQGPIVDCPSRGLPTPSPACIIVSPRNSQAHETLRAVALNNQQRLGFSMRNQGDFPATLSLTRVDFSPLLPSFCSSPSESHFLLLSYWSGLTRSLSRGPVFSVSTSELKYKALSTMAPTVRASG